MTGRSGAIPPLLGEPPPVQHMAALIVECGLLTPAVAGFVAQRAAEPGREEATAAAVRRMFPMLEVESDEPIPCDPWLADERLDDRYGGLDDYPDEFFELVGFAPPRTVLTVWRMGRHHYVDLGVWSSAHHDWWYAWLESNVAGEYYRHIAGPLPPSLDDRRDVVLEFLDQVDEWIGEPERIVTALHEPDRRWLRRRQEVPIGLERDPQALLALDRVRDDALRHGAVPQQPS